MNQSLMYNNFAVLQVHSQSNLHSNADPVYSAWCGALRLELAYEYDPYCLALPSLGVESVATSARSSL